MAVSQVYSALSFDVGGPQLHQSVRSVEKGQESAEALRDELWKEKWEDWETIFRTNVIG